MHCHWKPIFMAACGLMITAAVYAGDPSGDAASVNGNAITAAEVDREFHLLEKRLARQGRPLSGPQIEDARGQVLENLINMELLSQESRRQQIRIEGEAVEKQFNDFRSRFSSEADFGRALSEMGLTPDEVRVKIEETLAVRELIAQKVGDGETVTEEELRSFYQKNRSAFHQPEKVRARHILVKVGAETDKKEARAAIDDVRRRLEKGEDFAAVAREVSEGPSASRGGDLGFFGRGQMVEPFEKAAFSLENGAISPVVETRFGYHVLQVTDRKPEKTLVFDEVRDRLEQVMLQEKKKKETDRYIRELRKSATIERF